MNVRNEILRQILAAILAAVLALIFLCLDFTIPNQLTSTLFAVLGIFYSITMSLTISFDYKTVVNKTVRINIKNALTRIKTTNTVNFLISTCALVIFMPLANAIEVGYFRWLFEFYPLTTIIVSFVLSIKTFNSLFALKSELDDAVSKELDGK